MHSRAKLLSLEQRRQKQLLQLMFIHKHRHHVARIYHRETRAAGIFTFVYRNSLYYKGALLWDNLQISAYVERRYSKWMV